MAICVNYYNGLLEVCDGCTPRVMGQIMDPRRECLDDVASTCPSARCVRHGMDTVTPNLVSRIAATFLLVMHIPKGVKPGPMIVRFANCALSVCSACTPHVLLSLLTRNVTDEYVVAHCPTESCVITDETSQLPRTLFVVHVFRSVSVRAEEDLCCAWDW